MKIAMAREGKGFYGDGIDLAWPLGGERRVIEVSDDVASWPARLRDRYGNGVIVAVPDLEVTPVIGVEDSGRRFMRGGSPEAIAHMAIPAPDRVIARVAEAEPEVAADPAIAEEADGYAEPPEVIEEAEPEEAEAEPEAEEAPRRGRNRHVRASDGASAAEGASNG